MLTSNESDKSNGQLKQNSAPEAKKFDKFPWENEPRDRFYFVQVVLFLLGTVSLLPMTFFTTATEYWMYKFRNTSLDADDPDHRTYLQANFASLQMFAVVYPMVITNFIAVFIGHKVKPKIRVIAFLCSICMVLATHTAFVKIDTDDWQVSFFIITMACQVFISGGIGCVTLASYFPPHYTKTFLMGQGLGTLVTAVLRLISVTAAPSALGGGFIFFITGTVIMVLAQIMFIIATRSSFFRYYANATKEETKKKINSIRDIFKALKLIWKVVVLNSTLLLFPANAITNLVVSEEYDSETVWSKTYFVTVATYLIPAVCDIAGRALSNKFDKDFSWSFLFIAVTVRTSIIIPTIFFSNARPRNHTDVIFNHDWEYILIMAFHQCSLGFFMNAITLKNIRLVPKDKLDLSFSVSMLFLGGMAAITSPLGIILVSLL
ncbi:equilibrative nucleoside transporter 3-like isoform X2 [Cylas formicarius]|uniref:equilibrative nucleoside transporter 3-like isoform X2 n=1 Tax=Cylas formicarius TaxID=197179 RepID=UPI0029588AEB|nr:equilibrative nucleoside transporter 3-like isoform X2 [Cylas formicarius]